MNTFEINPISIEDLSYVSRIMQERWEVAPEWADTEVRRFLAQNSEAAGFCVHHNGKTIGVGLFDRYSDDVSTNHGPWLYLLWVDREYRGHNLGIELTKRRMEHARAHGYTELYLDTTGAQYYHQALGWEYVETITYEGESDVIMRYDLSKEFPSTVL